jgi:hypothetical protein
LNGFLLDTNIVSEFRKRKPHGAVASWFAGVPADQMFLPAVVLGELQAGVEITRIQDAAKALEIEEWVGHIEATLAVLPMDSASFREYARLMHGRSNALREDAMIAATAQVHGLTVATRNERDFRPFGVPVFNPFRAA